MQKDYLSCMMLIILCETKFSCVTISIITNLNWQLYTMFLCDDLLGKVYIVWPPGFSIEGEQHKVYRLVRPKKAINLCRQKFAMGLLTKIHGHLNRSKSTTYSKLRWNTCDLERYRKLVGKLIYLTSTYLDISFDVSVNPNITLLRLSDFDMSILKKVLHLGLQLSLGYLKPDPIQLGVWVMFA